MEKLQHLVGRVKFVVSKMGGGKSEEGNVQEELSVFGP